MILSGHQPVYLPGIQLFNKIALSDAFMFCGHCQYSPKSWHSRNYIKTGMLWVPVHKSPGQSIDETEIAEGGPWRRRHLKAIRMAYGKSVFFEDYFPALEEIIGHPWSSLASLNICLIEQILGWLGIAVPLYYGHELLDTEAHKTDMLISMCRAVGADQYLSNGGAREYVDEYKMLAAGIAPHWQQFKLPDYGQSTQVNGGNMSVVDLLFAKGPEAGSIIKRSGSIV